MNPTFPLVSVVVPVYKVEKYLEACVGSILGQTYRHLEILLVDDGSPDGCPALCDRLAARDGRIRVIHQHNQGLSVARNTGLDAATGEFVAFVDSDDWVEPDMIEVLLEVLRDHGADVVAAMPIPEMEDELDVPFPVPTLDGSATVYTRDEALEELLRDRILRNFAWLYLYRASLFDGIRFPPGMRFEDIHTTYRIFLKCQRIVALRVGKYHYRIRLGSITQTGGLVTLLDHYAAVSARAAALEDRFPRFRAAMIGQKFVLVLEVWRAASRTRSDSLRVHREALRDMARFVTRQRMEILAAMGYGRAGRGLVALCRYPHRWAFAAVSLLLAALAPARQRGNSAQ